MRVFISSVLLVVTVLKTAASVTTVRAAPEPMPFEEKQVVVEDDGAHRVLRGLQTDLTYKGQICSTEASGAMPCTAADTVCQPEQFDYWKLYLRAGTAYTMEVDRVSCNLDPAMTLFQGVGRTLPSGCFGDDGSAQLTPIARFDDNDQVPDYCPRDSSPWFDPNFVITPDRSGLYTLAVINHSSTVGTCKATEGYRYKVKINPRPYCA